MLAVHPRRKTTAGRTRCSVNPSGDATTIGMASLSARTPIAPRHSFLRIGPVRRPQFDGNAAGGGTGSDRDWTVTSCAMRRTCRRRAAGSKSAPGPRAASIRAPAGGVFLPAGTAEVVHRRAVRPPGRVLPPDPRWPGCAPAPDGGPGADPWSRFSYDAGLTINHKRSAWCLRARQIGFE
jgi:hypothetical protein